METGHRSSIKQPLHLYEPSINLYGYNEPRRTIISVNCAGKTNYVSRIEAELTFQSQKKHAVDVKEVKKTMFIVVSVGLLTIFPVLR